MATLSPDAVKAVLSQNAEQLRRDTNITEVEYIKTSIDYEEFFSRFLIPNKPCVFGPHLTREWRAVQEWMTEDGRPHFDFLSRQFGHAVVPVADCTRVEYSAQPKTDMPFAEYLQYWKKRSQSADEKDKRCLYLKDWHFNKHFPDYRAYETPVFFTSDWMNEYWDKKPGPASDDYRFVYMGPRESWTPFHADVFRSYSWSANVCGRKRWLLFPPGQENHLRDALGNLAYDVTSPELSDARKYPHYRKAGRPLEVIQEEGEVIFVPSGWHHQVFNIEDTVSINHNWLNGCNLDLSWAFLRQELASVKKSISDCRDMEGWDLQCQMIMKANAGIDYPEFLQLLWTVAEIRLDRVRTYKESRGTTPNSQPSQPGEPRDCRTLSLELRSPSTAVEPGIADTTADTWSSEVNASHNAPALSTDRVDSKPAARSLTDTDLDQGTDGLNRFQNSSRCAKGDDRAPTDAKLDIWHSVFDLVRIRNILLLLVEDEDFRRIECVTLCKDPQQLMTEIESANEDLAELV